MRKEIDQLLFEESKNSKFAGRYLSYDLVEEYLKSLSDFCHLKCEGHSVLNRPIYSLEMGRGKKRILLWSQMHGNETTTTKAILDFVKGMVQRSPFFESLLQYFTFKIIPILNPDGAVAYTRENANAVDLNRDAMNSSQPEMRLLQTLARDFAPDFCFNMHDQRTIYGVGDTDKPATLSFLSPASDEARTITPSRATAMQVIAGINEFLQAFIPGQVGRYDDTFNPNCIGDYFQSKQIPTILFEAGHFPQDYRREETRKYVFLALCKAMSLIENDGGNARRIAAYLKIPENKKSFYDVMVRNALVDGKTTDVAIQYEEKLRNGKIDFVPKIEKIEKIDQKHAHFSIDAKHKEIVIIPKSKLEKGSIAEKLAINIKISSLKLTNN